MKGAPRPRGRVLVIAGSDSGGGAGIQADIKTVTALGGYAATAVTALTAQNTRGVFAIQDVPVDFIVRQIELVLEDIGADAVKIGMLGRSEVIDAVCDTLQRLAPGVPVVVDPVMVAKGGAALLELDARATLRRRLLAIATLITPNIPEAEVLIGTTIADTEAMRAAALALLTAGPEAVLLKGGHLSTSAGKAGRVHDFLATESGVEEFRDERIETRHTHGTGCTLSSAVATGLAQGLELRAAIVRARAYVRAALLAAPGLGHGHGPLGHGHTVRPFGMEGG